MSLSNNVQDLQPRSLIEPGSRPLVLAVDTTSRRRSIAISTAGRLIGLLAFDAAGTHSWQLHGEVEFLLEKTGVRLADVDAFGVTVGPGSFTGVRVGIAAVKGYAHSLGKPVVGVSALLACALAAGVSGLVCASLDALRGEIYSQLFLIHMDGSIDAVTGPTLGAPGQIIGSLADEPMITFIGEDPPGFYHALCRRGARVGRKVRRAVCPSVSEGGWWVIERRPYLAESVAVWATRETQRGHVQSPAELRALYVRPSEAEARKKDP